MMPIRINLLSSTKQKHLNRMIYFQFVKNTLEILLFVLAVTGSVVLYSHYILQKNFNDLAERSIAINGEHGKEKTEIREINKMLIDVKKIQDSYTLWTPIISRIANSIPEGVILHSLSIDKTTKELSVAGNAATREDLLDLQTNLETLEFLSDLELPINQLVKKENVLFNIKAKIEL